MPHLSVDSRPLVEGNLNSSEKTQYTEHFSSPLLNMRNTTNRLLKSSNIYGVFTLCSVLSEVLGCVRNVKINTKQPLTLWRQISRERSPYKQMNTTGVVKVQGSGYTMKEFLRKKCFGAAVLCSAGPLRGHLSVILLLHFPLEMPFKKCPKKIFYPSF